LNLKLRDWLLLILLNGQVLLLAYGILF